MTGAWPARDPGLQPERTALAWRRTALAVGAGAAVAARLTAPALGALAVVLGVLGGSAAAALWFLAGRRYAVGRPGAGALVAGTALLAAVTGVLALGLVTGLLR